MTKHKPHTVKQWGRICDDTERSGLSTFDYCKQHNISFQTLYTWRSKLRKAKLSSTNDNNHFLGVELKDSSSKPLSTSKPSDNINIFINCQIGISVNEELNESLLLETITVINEAISGIGIQKTYLYRKPTHMTWRFEGLSDLVDHIFPDELLTGAYFIFLNKTVNKIKIIWWDGDGLLIFYKRLENGRFAVDSKGNTELSGRGFQMLFEGIKPSTLNRRFSLSTS